MRLFERTIKWLTDHKMSVPDGYRTALHWRDVGDGLVVIYHEDDDYRLTFYRSRTAKRIGTYSLGLIMAPTRFIEERFFDATQGMDILPNEWLEDVVENAPPDWPCR